ncbi:hypothetical protein Dpep_0043 [Dethiosulfovibrio peptidovorans DSM 11002]|uniref:Uncharacterized protein n=1 Tax=Dethiosulfovibrio peptidovorans DSM 11002 TaxID=469381 RepID=D2Z2B9_9BACT|nr:hypothetical protein [Dethiosulfovibrio peptidovorans]EFC90075.1 hypothetical protein Dpep_0043 [Dethiosulfovibrio peptidovorans DSM 11002]
MEYKCPYCKSKIDSYYQTGVLLAPPEDQKDFLVKSTMTLRLNAQFKPMVMMICKKCGVATFVDPSTADLDNLTPVPYEETVKGDPISEKEKIRRARKTLDDLAGMVDKAEKE